MGRKIKKGRLMQKYPDQLTVYAITSYNTVEECIVVFCVENESSTGQNVYRLGSTYNGQEFCATEDRVFLTKEEAENAYQQKYNSKVEKYKKELGSLKSLLEFPLNHCICGSKEYVDQEARQAYQETIALFLDKNDKGEKYDRR